MTRAFRRLGGKIGEVKPAPFIYHAPEDLGEALAILAEVGHDGKILAGGQSLVPLLSMRLASPAHVIDINKITELAYVRVDDDSVRVGALARHAEVERDDPAGAAQPLLREALRQVAHPVVRNRGTTLGSIVHADPSGEMPAVLALVEGEVEVASSTGRRVITADDLFLGPLESLAAARRIGDRGTVPGGSARVGQRVHRGGPPPRRLRSLRRRRRGRALSSDGTIVTARAAYVSVAGTPQCLDLTEPLAAGRSGVGGPGQDRRPGARAGPTRR